MFHKIKINYQFAKHAIKIILIDWLNFRNVSKNNKKEQNNNKIKRDNKKIKEKYN